MMTADGDGSRLFQRCLSPVDSSSFLGRKTLARKIAVRLLDEARSVRDNGDNLEII